MADARFDIQYANLKWQDGSCENVDYGDHYFYREDGFGESEYVFIEGNQLSTRWRHSAEFSIGEIGFGTGLNFFLSVQHWLEQNTVQGVLHYFSCEKNLLKPNDFLRANQAWPSLAPLFQEFFSHYPPLCPGLLSFNLYQGRVKLHLFLGEAKTMLEQMDGLIDAWFLDGFAPKYNADAWSTKLLRNIAQRSRLGASFATFTAASAVRQSLVEHGFLVYKRKGYGKKREMLCGFLQSKTYVKTLTPWFARSRQGIAKKEIIIIGAGIVGVMSAYVLALQGWQVSLVEKEAGVCTQASGNPYGIVMPRVTRDFKYQTQFYMQSFLQIQAFLDAFKQAHPQLLWYKTGVLQTLSNDEWKDYQKLPQQNSMYRCLSQTDIEKQFKLKTEKPALFFPQAGILNPASLAQHILSLDSPIQLITGCPIERIDYENHAWSLFSNQNEKVMTCPNVLVANSFAATQFPQNTHLSVNKNRGQLVYLPEQTLQSCPDFVLSGEAYCIHTQNQNIVGASYGLDDSNKLSDEDQRHILNTLQTELAMPSLDNPMPLAGRVAFRGMTPDRMPLVGPVADEDYFRQSYQYLIKGAPAWRMSKAQYLPGLYVNTGHGSRGLCSALSSANLISEYLQNQVFSFSKSIVHGLHPARYLIKHLKHTEKV